MTTTKPSRPTTVKLWVVADPAGVAVERPVRVAGLPRSIAADHATLRTNQHFGIGEVLPADIPADTLHHLTAAGRVQAVVVPLNQEK